MNSAYPNGPNCCLLCSDSAVGDRVSTIEYSEFVFVFKISVKLPLRTIEMQRNLSHALPAFSAANCAYWIEVGYSGLVSLKTLGQPRENFFITETHITTFVSNIF